MTAYVIPGICTVEEVIAEVFGTSVNAMKSKSRDRNIVEARHAAMWYYMKYKGYSENVCGKLFNRNHCTAHYAKRQVDILCKVDKIFRSKMDEVMKRCNIPEI